ncbi:MAG: nitrate- and nitrite sensing domain-containing protein, partial [Desulfurobacteriaceae bacterium]
LRALQKEVLLSTRISAVVHELQKERGRTAGFLGSGGETFSKELKEQRRETDRKIAELESILNKEYLMSLPEEARKKLLSVLDSLNSLSIVRRKVDKLRVDLRSAIAFYTNLNNQLIDSVGEIAKTADDASIARELIGYADFMYAKEKAGLERAVLSVAFANRKFPTRELFEKFIDLLAQQKAFIKAFTLSSPKEVIDFYRRIVVNSESYTRVKSFERMALESPFEGVLEVSPNLWFSVITEKIDKMKQVEDFIAKDLTVRMENLERDTNGEFYVVLLVSIVAVLSTAGTLYFLTRRG